MTKTFSLSGLRKSLQIQNSEHGRRIHKRLELWECVTFFLREVSVRFEP